MYLSVYLGRAMYGTTYTMSERRNYDNGNRYALELRAGDDVDALQVMRLYHAERLRCDKRMGRGCQIAIADSERTGGIAKLSRSQIEVGGLMREITEWVQV